MNSCLLRGGVWTTNPLALGHPQCRPLLPSVEEVGRQRGFAAFHRRVRDNVLQVFGSIESIEEREASFREAPFPIDTAVLVVIAKSSNLRSLFRVTGYQLGMAKEHAGGEIRVVGVQVDDVTVGDVE